MGAHRTVVGSSAPGRTGCAAWVVASIDNSIANSAFGNNNSYGADRSGMNNLVTAQETKLERC